MADPFLGEIRAVGFTFPPRGWAECSGQLLLISQNTALFALLGTMYGGDGRTTFGLPDLRGRAVVGQGPYFPGEAAGVERVALSTAQLPSHGHGMKGSSSAATQNSPEGGVFAVPAVNPRMATLYQASPGAQGAAQGTTPAGSDVPHNNMQPYLTVRYVIALAGVFPSR